MTDVNRANLILALAEVVKDVEVIDIICEKSGRFNDHSELELLEKKVMSKVMAYRTHDLWPPEIEPITDVMNFNS